MFGKGSSWRQWIVDLGVIGGWDDLYTAPEGSIGLASPMHGYPPGWYLTNFRYPTGPNHFVVTLVGTPPTLSYTGVPIIAPGTPFPYGYDVDPDVPL